jgi:hypothetical protein
MEVLSHVMLSQDEQVFKLGKRQANILAEIVSGTPFVDIEGSSPLARREIRDELGSFNYADTFVHSGDTNISRPIVVDGLVGKAARRGGYISGLAKDDLNSLLRTSTEACSSRQMPLVLRLVYGATEQASLRALSYPLPAMQAIDRIREQSGIAPYLQIVFADNISGTLNCLDEQKVRDESAMMLEAIRQVGVRIGVSEQVGFYDDSSVALDDIDEAARMFRIVAPENFLKLLAGKGSDNDLEVTCRYTAAHYILHDHPDTHLTHSSGAEMPASANIVDIGGIQERYFKSARVLIGKALRAEVQSSQIYTKHHVPPYYMARGGDIALRDFLEGKQLDNNLAVAARTDITYLSNSIDLFQLQEEVCNV